MFNKKKEVAEPRIYSEIAKIKIDKYRSEFLEFIPKDGNELRVSFERSYDEMYPWLTITEYYKHRYALWSRTIPATDISDIQIEYRLVEENNDD